MPSPRSGSNCTSVQKSKAASSPPSALLPTPTTTSIVRLLCVSTEFYQFLAKRNLFIYPGKTTKADTFRVGSIGDLNAEDMHILVEAITEALKSMGVTLPIKY